MNRSENVGHRFRTSLTDIWKQNKKRVRNGEHEKPYHTDT